MVSIHVRPPEADDRIMPGHWGRGDLLMGAGNKSAVGVLAQRITRLVLLYSTAGSALAAFTFKRNQVAAPLRQTLTYDQGKEMAKHQELARATGMRVYFRDSHSPWRKLPLYADTPKVEALAVLNSICVMSRSTSWGRRSLHSII